MAPVEYSFTKRKIPRGLSFPLKRSALDSQLEAAGVSQVASVYYTTHQGARSEWSGPAANAILRATYCNEGLRGWMFAGMASIYVFPVPSSRRKEIEEAIHSRVMPALLKWLIELERAGNTRRGHDQVFEAAFTAEGEMDISAS